MALSSLEGRDVDPNESRQAESLREIVAFVVLATLFVAARFVSKRFSKASLGLDDWTIVLGLILTWGTFATAAYEIDLGTGTHTSTIPPQNIVPHKKAQFSISLIYCSAITTIKFSILFFYTRIFDTRTFILITRGISVVLVAWWISVLFLGVFSCVPVNGFWNSTINSKCIDPTNYYIGVAIPNIITDFVILVLPVRVVWRLRLTRGQKVALSATFLTGAIVIVASLYRIVRLPATADSDPFWSYTDANKWTSIEPSIGVVAACLPTLRPLLRILRRKGATITGATSNSSGNPSRFYDTIALDSIRPKSVNTKASNQRHWPENKEHGLLETRIPWGGAVTSTKVVAADPERDDSLLGINVQHDVDVERGPLYSPIS